MERQFSLVTSSLFDDIFASRARTMFDPSPKIEDLQKSKKWRPFHATDFNSLMYPCFLMSALFGSFPYKLSSGYSFSKTNVVYTIFVLIVFLSTLLLIEYKLNFDLVLLTTIPKVLNLHLYIILSGTIILITYAQTGMRLRLFQELSDASSILESKDFDKLAKFIHSKDIAVFLYLWSHLPNCDGGNPYTTVKNCMVLCMVLFACTTNMLYMNCVCVLKVCFAKINEDLDRLREPVGQECLRYGERTSLLLKKLKSFQEKHLRLTDVQQLLNNTFLVQITVVTITTFTVVTFNLYFFLLFLGGGDYESKNHFWYFPYIANGTYHFVQYAMLIWACETATNRAGEIRTILHRILCDVTDLSVKRQVQLFSLQLLHYENTFSVRMFEMNASLLAEMVRGVVMYLLILIQFLLNTVACMMEEGKIE